MACGSASSRQRTDPTPSSVTIPPVRNVIEYRKDGAVSKMRSHKGNVPVLPQTKLCPHCPAKFTRTTHLNRHMRTHTGDRSHRCDTCDAQFTRSDLLTRHKKTCGDSSHANRTRRRSCQACSDSKVKCDLQRPCSKCQARGKECVFVIRPSRPSGMGMVVPTLSTTTVERSSDSEDRGPVLIPTPPHPATSPSPKPYNAADHVPIDQQPEGDCHWATGPPGASSDVLSASSPSDRFCSSTSDSGSPAAVASQSSFATFFPGDLLDSFLAYPHNYNHTSDHSHSPNEPVVPSPISAADDPTSFATQGVDVQHPFHASGGSVYYAPSSGEQVQDVIPKEHVHLQRSRYAQDHFMPSFSGPIHNFKQANLTEEQHQFVFDASPPRSRVRTAGPYQIYGSARRALRESHLGGQIHLASVDAIDGDYYGRHCDKSTNQVRVSGTVTPTHHWPVVPLENDMFDALQRLGSDDQRYRGPFAECAVDTLQWHGHLTRRQAIEPA